MCVCARVCVFVRERERERAHWPSVLYELDMSDILWSPYPTFFPQAPPTRLQHRSFLHPDQLHHQNKIKIKLSRFASKKVQTQNMC